MRQFIQEQLQIVSFIEALSADEDGVLAGVSAGNPGIEIGPEDIGTLSFTSGSTGIPKGGCARHHQGGAHAHTSSCGGGGGGGAQVCAVGTFRTRTFTRGWRKSLA
jgi:acyl-CoA synthetase (AMP-forming)/AMP-acid ligase II